jgi:hypothetical protein
MAMATVKPMIDTTQTKQDQRVAAVKIIQATLGSDKVQVFNPKEALQGYEAVGPVDSKAGPAIEGHYSCVTQRVAPSSVASILVGLFTEIPRWKYGSTVNFAAYSSGYPNPEDAQFAAVRLWEAADQWNRCDLGIKFQWVDKLEDATFVLEYGNKLDGVLASAFFPNNKPLNTLLVYEEGLSPHYRGMLKNIFLHELGHVLGLRHEFAMDPAPPGLESEGGAVVLGSRNPLSVMNYGNWPPEIQPSDIADTKKFYKLPPVKDYIPA